MTARGESAGQGRLGLRPEFRLFASRTMGALLLLTAHALPPKGLAAPPPDRLALPHDDEATLIQNLPSLTMGAFDLQRIPRDAIRVTGSATLVNGSYVYPIVACIGTSGDGCPGSGGAKLTLNGSAAAPWKLIGTVRALTMSGTLSGPHSQQAFLTLDHLVCTLRTATLTSTLDGGGALDVERGSVEVRLDGMPASFDPIHSSAVVTLTMTDALLHGIEVAVSSAGCGKTAVTGRSQKIEAQFALERSPPLEGLVGAFRMDPLTLTCADATDAMPLGPFALGDYTASLARWSLGDGGRSVDGAELVASSAPPAHWLVSAVPALQFDDLRFELHDASAKTTRLGTSLIVSDWRGHRGRWAAHPTLSPSLVVSTNNADRITGDIMSLAPLSLESTIAAPARDLKHASGLTASLGPVRGTTSFADAQSSVHLDGTFLESAGPGYRVTPASGQISLEYSTSTNWSGAWPTAHHARIELGADGIGPMQLDGRVESANEGATFAIASGSLTLQRDLRLHLAASSLSAALWGGRLETSTPASIDMALHAGTSMGARLSPCRFEAPWSVQAAKVSIGNVLFQAAHITSDLASVTTRADDIACTSGAFALRGLAPASLATTLSAQDGWLELTGAGAVDDARLDCDSSSFMTPRVRLEAPSAARADGRITCLLRHATLRGVTSPAHQSAVALTCDDLGAEGVSYVRQGGSLQSSLMAGKDELVPIDDAAGTTVQLSALIKLRQILAGAAVPPAPSMITKAAVVDGIISDMGAMVMNSLCTPDTPWIPVVVLNVEASGSPSMAVPLGRLAASAFVEGADSDFERLALATAVRPELVAEEWRVAADSDASTSLALLSTSFLDLQCMHDSARLVSLPPLAMPKAVARMPSALNAASPCSDVQSAILAACDFLAAP